jgi:hypothetical protein
MQMTKRQHADAVRKSEPAEITISFDKSVTKDFARLYHGLEHSTSIDCETLAHVESLSKEGTKFLLPIAFAAITQVVRDTTAFAIKTTNQGLFEILDDLNSNLSGFGESPSPIKLHGAPRSLRMPPRH